MLIYIGPILGTIALILGFKLTGMKGRNYSVLQPDAVVNGQKIIDILEKYKPIIYQTENIKIEVEYFLYEFVEQEDKLVLLYRPLWRDEIHPNKVIHHLYKYFREIYYGSVKDIEFIEIFVDKKTGDILSFSFETLTPGTHLRKPGHEFTNIVKKGDKFYNQTKNDELVSAPFEGSRCVLQVKTWNHLLCINENPEGKKFDLPLKYLTNWQYRKYAFSRRSSGFIKTPLNKNVKYYVSISLTLFFGLLLPLMLYFLLR
jgi:hypothetical protein